MPYKVSVTCSGLLTEENNKCNARNQVSDGMLDKHSKDLQASNCAKERQLIRAETQEVKGNSYKLSRNQR